MFKKFFDKRIFLLAVAVIAALALATWAFAEEPVFLIEPRVLEYYQVIPVVGNVSDQQPGGHPDITSFNVVISFTSDTPPTLIRAMISPELSLAGWRWVYKSKPGWISVAGAGTMPLSVGKTELFHVWFEDFYFGVLQIDFQLAEINGGSQEHDGASVLAQGAIVQILPIYGDVIRDTKITQEDALAVLKSVIGLSTLTPAQFIAADVSGNGTISTLDAMLILQYAIGLIKRFPCEAKGAPAKHEENFNELVAQLRASKKVEKETLGLLVQAREHELKRIKSRPPTTWGALKNKQ